MSLYSFVDRDHVVVVKRSGLEAIALDVEWREKERAFAVHYLNKLREAEIVEQQKHKRGGKE